MPETKSPFSSDFTLGIVGGGQLGKMILHDTQKYDIRTKILDPAANAPSRIGCNTFEQGSLTDFDTVYNFGKDCDAITIEIENVNTEALAKLESEGKKVYPRPKALDIIKNKSIQKQFYREEHIPTSPFFTFNSKAEMLELLKQKAYKAPFVWKSATGGYDGKGVQIVKDMADIEAIPDVPGLVEELINYKKELAIIIIRNPEGDTTTFPIVEMDFHPTANLVEYVFSPALVDERHIQQAKSIAEKVASSLNHVGVLAIELFLTTDDDILVNEMAPRVHNSGHLTIEGNETSQFEQHLRAVLNLPLGSTEMIRPAVMINLVGDENYTGPVFYEGIEDVMTVPGVYVHLYGKAETKPFRKMGHITITGKTLDEARNKAKDIRQKIRVISK